MFCMLSNWTTGIYDTSNEMINVHLFLCSLGGLLCEVGVLHYAGIEHGNLQQLVVVVVHHAAHRTDNVINGTAIV
jgi:hypothetical protein